ncbi:MAG: dTMP kinase [Proteobacteria bacterium]|nr:dTMP kinase [Pseudomonadota bacterium]
MSKNTSPARGIFITFEGGEGGGKSTQVRRLAEELTVAGRDVVITREPGGTPYAEAIRKVLLSPESPGDALTEALLFAAARRDHVRALIEPALAAGKVVLCDRFTDSTRAYQGGRLPDATIEGIISLATAGLTPDLTLLLDISPEKGLARAKARSSATDAFEREGLKFHKEVRERFLELSEKEPLRFAVIDAAATEDAVAQEIHDAVFLHLGDRL